MASMEMAGFSLTLMLLNSERIQCLGITRASLSLSTLLVAAFCTCCKPAQRDGVSNTVERNSSVFSLFRSCLLPSSRKCSFDCDVDKLIFKSLFYYLL